MSPSIKRAIVRAGLGIVTLFVFTFIALAQGIHSNPTPLYAYGECPAPNYEGFNNCNPGPIQGGAWETDSPFQIIAAATSGHGQVQQIQLWSDGKKILTSANNPIDLPVSLKTGTHKLQLVAVDSIGDVINSQTFGVDIQSDISANCPAPSSPGVNICTPTNNSCNTQPWVDISATGKGKSGKVEYMELWEGSDKIANFSGSKINTSLIMLSGKITITEVDSKGNAISSVINVEGPC